VSSHSGGTEVNQAIPFAKGIGLSPISATVVTKPVHFSKRVEPSKELAIDMQTVVEKGAAKNTDQALEVFNNLNGLYALFAKFG